MRGSVIYLFIYFISFRQVIIEIKETKVTITLENIQEKEINTNIEDIFG